MTPSHTSPRLACTTVVALRFAKGISIPSGHPGVFSAGGSQNCSSTISRHALKIKSLAFFLLYKEEKRAGLLRPINVIMRIVTVLAQAYMAD